MQRENRIRGQDDFLNQISEVICELLVVSGLCHASHIPAWSHCKTKRNGCANAGLAMPKLHEDTSKNICRIGWPLWHPSFYSEFRTSCLSNSETWCHRKWQLQTISSWFGEAQGRRMAVLAQWPAQRVAQAISWSGIQVRENTETKHAEMSTKSGNE